MPNRLPTPPWDNNEGFVLNEFKTKKQAVAFCKEMDWEIVK